MKKTRTRDRGMRAIPAPEANAELQTNIDVCIFNMLFSVIWTSPGSLLSTSCHIGKQQNYIILSFAFWESQLYLYPFIFSYHHCPQAEALHIYMFVRSKFPLKLLLRIVFLEASYTFFICNGSLEWNYGFNLYWCCHHLFNEKRTAKILLKADECR